VTTSEETTAAPEPLTRARAPRGRRSSLLTQDRRLGLWLVAPAVIVLLAITGYPLIYNVWNSFHHVDYLAPPLGAFAGFSNYAKLFHNPLPTLSFVPALAHTVGFTVVSVTIEVLIGLAIALALNKPFRGRGIVRAAVFIPWAVPTVVSAELWRTMFDPQQGFVNYVLRELHLPLTGTTISPYTWLDHTWTGWGALLAADAWRNTPFVAIILLAGLQVIPQDIYEAARIDGAGAWETFRRLTLPMLKPALMVALIFRTLQSFMIFDVVYIMEPGGGPGTSHQVLANLDYQAFLQEFDFGFGGAVSIAMVIMALIIAGVYVRVFRTEQPA
jgi:ABC-type sugar transport system permease subunit